MTCYHIKNVYSHPQGRVHIDHPVALIGGDISLGSPHHLLKAIILYRHKHQQHILESKLVFFSIPFSKRKKFCDTSLISPTSFPSLLVTFEHSPQYGWSFSADTTRCHLLLLNRTLTTYYIYNFSILAKMN
jgi:hypothetical protein